MDTKESPKAFLAALSNLNLGRSAEIVFGEPIKQDPFLLVPVAKIRYGYGYGHGSLGQTSSGGGFGGGAMVRPIGYIVIEREKVYFKKIPSWSILKVAACFAVGILLTKVLKAKSSFKSSRKITHIDA